MLKEWSTKSLRDLDPAIQYVKSVLQAGDIVLFKGEVGAGKTTFIRELLLALGEVGSNSPTFAIHNQYSTTKYKVHHLDLYRLETEDELLSVGFEDFVKDQTSVVLIEWAERLSETQLPRQRRKFELIIDRNEENRQLRWKEM
jgi:tRNA threonylcarbamoyladenosine biosynthesis protein TsaE